MKILVGSGRKVHLADVYNGKIIGTICGAGNQGISTRHRSSFTKVSDETKVTCQRCLQLKEE